MYIYIYIYVIIMIKRITITITILLLLLLIIIIITIYNIICQQHLSMLRSAAICYDMLCYNILYYAITTLCCTITYYNLVSHHTTIVLNIAYYELISYEMRCRDATQSHPPRRETGCAFVGRAAPSWWRLNGYLA